MASYVVDTQAIVKFLAGKKVINDRPSVVIFEIGYLHEKGRIPVSL